MQNATALLAKAWKFGNSHWANLAKFVAKACSGITTRAEMDGEERRKKSMVDHLNDVASFSAKA